MKKFLIFCLFCIDINIDNFYIIIVSLKIRLRRG